MDNQTPLFTIKEAARYLGYTYNTTLQYIQRGKIKAYNIDPYKKPTKTRYRLYKKDLDFFVEQRKSKQELRKKKKLQKTKRVKKPKNK